MNADIVIIGGGAAGFFTAINTAMHLPIATIVMLERGKEVLTKVKVSGGGRCNVTHADFDPRSFTTNYPRGEKELLGPFHSFMSGDVMGWFEERGVPLKIEEDGRVFPESNSSQTIIDCFINEARKYGVIINKQQSVKRILKTEIGWKLDTQDTQYNTKHLVVATGSNVKIWDMLQSLQHTIVPPVPSLFTFHCKEELIQGLQGISTSVIVTLIDAKGNSILETDGPLLITHWGFSGPAVLKMSAWGARILANTNYNGKLIINWVPELSTTDMLEILKEHKLQAAKQTVYKYPQFNLPKRLWQQWVKSLGIAPTVKWADVSNKQLSDLVHLLHKSEFDISGKSTFKEEFVTAGGIALDEVNFKTFESKIHNNLYFAGEVLNIDAITGGFNFQNAWTGGYKVAQSLISKN